MFLSNLNNFAEYFLRFRCLSFFPTVFGKSSSLRKFFCAQLLSFNTQWLLSQQLSDCFLRSLLKLADYRGPSFESGSMQQGMYVPKGMFVRTREVLRWIVKKIGDCRPNVRIALSCVPIFYPQILSGRTTLILCSSCCGLSIVKMYILLCSATRPCEYTWTCELYLLRTHQYRCCTALMHVPFVTYAASIAESIRLL